VLKKQVFLFAVITSCAAALGAESTVPKGQGAVPSVLAGGGRYVFGQVGNDLYMLDIVNGRLWRVVEKRQGEDMRQVLQPVPYLPKEDQVYP